MVTQQTAIETAQAFIRDCKKAGLVFDKVLLFGSYAKGTPHEGSDIDLLLVSSLFTDDVFANLHLYSKINVNYPIIETHPMPTHSLKEDNEFIEKISRDGIEITP
jgi:uncharacterized protein